ncbi:MAG TPA: substrate-binding domain-containing protein [Phototrophicaceae bacterium]|nr:substrate-binding domain-containing protein [Phototrophicaceae bacterium]
MKIGFNPIRNTASQSRFSKLLIVFLGLALLITACSSAAPTATPTAPPQITLTISGSGSVSSLLTTLKADFEAAHPGYNLNILSGTGTGGGVKGVLDGSLTVAAMARAPKDDETAQGLQYVRIGGSAVAFIVHPEVKVTNLTQEQVRAIFFAETTNWSEVGGPDLPIVVYVRDEDESATTMLRQTFFGDTAFPESIAGVMTSASALLDAVQGTPGSIGFGTWAAIVAGKKNVSMVKLDGAAPDSPDYPVISMLGLGYLESQQAAVQPLLDWLSSTTGRGALNQLGVITELDS